MRILYGLDRLPATLAADDARLPAVDLDARKLRLNSLPLPPKSWSADAWPGEAWPADASTAAAGADEHAARMRAARSWLLAGCGDYNEVLRRGVTCYLDAVAAHVARHREALSAGLARFHGLYQVEDWCWSALRPLPRAWWQRDGEWTRADLAFWDGETVIALRARDFDADALPPPFQHFWDGEILPVSPFRRAFPANGLSLRPSSP